MKLTKRLSIIALVIVMCFAMCASAFASWSSFSVQMYGTRGIPSNGVNTEKNMYYSYFYNTVYWVGGDYTRVGKPVYMIQGYLLADGEFSSVDSVDGYHGNKTDAAIRAYQGRYSSAGLTVDGVAGTNTWNHMVYTKYHDTIAYLLPYEPTAK